MPRNFHETVPAYLADPSVLVLDEATSAIDVGTERRIQQAFRMLSAGRTTLVIAHRLETIRSAYRIAVIEEGDVREIDTHDALIAKRGHYAALYDSYEDAAGRECVRPHVATAWLGIKMKSPR